MLIYRNRYRSGANQLSTELAAETIRPFEKGNYRAIWWCCTAAGKIGHVPDTNAWLQTLGLAPDPVT
ncbi:hypothetical protein [Mycolicibacterium sarraceniae]|uniref:Uncharacterized protein n=1 Tax=Mycolicibacterium sarraceniae TaxID=1534348 RepID=A0A7I7SXY0_9MYCO|nr:hypothetical protein [Mycolicibacterium sarraceniae]BBY60865.1 hypothetical protein MSAR_40010 [Mycolicibacterium sarraceniae]